MVNEYANCNGAIVGLSVVLTLKLMLTIQTEYSRLFKCDQDQFRANKDIRTAAL